MSSIKQHEQTSPSHDCPTAEGIELLLWHQLPRARNSIKQTAYTLTHTHKKKKKNSLSTRRHIFAELEFGFSKKKGPGKGARFPHHTNTRMTHRDTEQNRLRLSGLTWPSLSLSLQGRDPGIRGPLIWAGPFASFRIYGCTTGLKVDDNTQLSCKPKSLFFTTLQSRGCSNGRRAWIGAG